MIKPYKFLIFIYEKVLRITTGMFKYEIIGLLENIGEINILKNGFPL